MRKKKIVMPIHGIHTAAKNGDLKAVEQYLDQGVSPDIQEDSVCCFFFCFFFNLFIFL